MKKPFWMLLFLYPIILIWAWWARGSLYFRGRDLEGWELELARKVGVTHPERVRIALVDALPFPLIPGVRQLAAHYGMNGTNAVGLTLGHGVFVRRGFYSLKVASHEFRHVQQYEESGSVARLLLRYLAEVIRYGYRDAPLEQDARAHEVSGVQTAGQMRQTVLDMSLPKNQ